MKKLTLITITLFALLSCNAQLPKMDAYSVEKMDSVINHYTGIIENKQFENDSLQVRLNHYEGDTMFIPDTTKQIVFGRNLKYQLDYDQDGFEFLFIEGSYLYRLLSDSVGITVVKHDRSKNLDIEMSIKLD